MNRREMLSALAASSVVLGTGAAHGRASSAVEGPRFAVTIDDFQMADGPLLDGAAKHHAILTALDTVGIQAAGFVAGRHVDSEDGRMRLAEWVEAGHAIGNHTYSHAYYGGADPADLGEDIDRTARLMQGYATARPWFRFPYLAEGRTAEARDGMREVLRARQLTNGHVTIDASDWYVAQRLAERLAREPAADVAPYRDYLVAHLLDRARFYDGLARDVLGRSPAHTLLLHHNLTTALFLPDVLRAFRAEGWTAVDAEEAFADPVFRAQPDIVPAANGLIWQLAGADGRFNDRLRSPGEDGSYEKAAMDAMGL